MTRCSRCGTPTCSRSSSGWAAWSCSARSSRPATFQVLQAMRPAPGARSRASCSADAARFHYVAYASGGVLLVTLAAMALLGPRPRSFAIRAAIIAVMLGVALYSGVVVLGEIDAIQREIAATSSATLRDALGRGSALAAARRRRAAHPLRRAASALDAADDGQHRRRAGAAVLGSA